MSKSNFSTKQETGYADPLSNCADFNILNFINSSDAPDSPYCQQNYPQMNGIHLEHQQMQQRQQMPNSNHLQHNLQRQMHPVILDNGILYNRTTHLPESPPITDISAGASSGSPSSSDSPYSPENYNYIQGHQMHNGNHMTMQIATDATMLTQQDLIRAQMGGNIRIQAQQTQVSPNSDFLSPYPAQTPGSHHSQVSPPAINQHTQSFLLDAQQNYPLESYLMGNDDFGDINISDYNSPMSRKRQRLSDVSTPVIKNESSYIPPPSSTPLPGGMTHQSSVGSMESPHGGSLDDFDDCNNQRTIRFSAFDPHLWSTLYDQNQRELPSLKVNVVADKGFNFSSSDNCFVNQKKNHFQITVLIKATNESSPCFAMTNDQTLHTVTGFKLAFCGAKSEMTSSEIQIRQSQTDRKPIPHDPVQLNIAPLKLTKVTVPRLHFSETTMNNHRKNGRPNPDQKYFYLIVKLLAETPNGMITVQSYASDKVIVRASNPGQFEPAETEVAWQKQHNVLHYGGPVAIGTDKPFDEAQLTVLGNIVSTGKLTRPSDRRVKEDIIDLDTRDAMDRIANVRIVEYNYKPELAEQWGLDETSRHRVGVIAQELAEVIPDAVRDNGEFLTVDDARIFYDTVAAAQELYRLTGNLECKIDQVEKISAKLARFAQKRKQMGSMSGLSDITMLLNNISRDKKISDGIDDEKNMNTKNGHYQSHLSLNSTTPSIDASASQIGSASQTGYYRSRRARNGKYQEQSLCTSKLTQMTMIALVIIMSLCLITMCSLYVLDWYHRTYVYTADSFPRNYPTANPGDVGHFKEWTNDYWKPPIQYLVDPLLGTCSASVCALYCCSPQRVFNSSSDKAVIVLDNPASPPEIRSDSKGNQDTSKSLDSGVEIKLVNLNMTIDGQYCIENSCNARKGFYSLYVPVSDFYPTMPIRVHFGIEDGIFIDNCGRSDSFIYKHCEVDRDEEVKPHALKIDEYTFELNAAKFVQSSFTFRIGYSTDMCSMSEGQQGRSFDEYKLIFYRSCADGWNIERVENE